MIDAAIIFAATFFTVFALGLQSLNVNGRHYAMAAGTSLVIGASHLVLYKFLPGQTTPGQVLAYLLAGPVAIIAAMWAHPRLAARLLPGPAAQEAQPTYEDELPRKWADTMQMGAGLAPLSTVHMEPSALEKLARDLIDPDALGFACTQEVRERAAAALGRVSAPYV